MASQEEVDIVLKTVADTSGAAQTQQAISQTQQAAQQATQALTAGQQGANVALQQVMQGQQQTLENFRKAVETVRLSTGRAPTLGPEAFGISEQATQAAVGRVQTVSRAFAELQTARQRTLAGAADPEEARLYTARQQQQRQFDQLIQERARLVARGGAVPTDEAPPAAQAALGAAVQRQLEATTRTAREAADAQRTLGLSFHATGEDMIRFGAALAGIPIGLSLFIGAGRIVHDLLDSIIQRQGALQQSSRDLALTYGQTAQVFTDFARGGAQGPAGRNLLGFDPLQVQQSQLTTRALAQQAQLTKEQQNQIVGAAQRVVDVRGLNADQLTPVTDKLTAGLQGNAAAVADLNLDLSDATVAARAFGGAYSSTFSALDDRNKVLARLDVLLQEVTQQQDRARDSGQNLASSTRVAQNANQALVDTLAQGPFQSAQEFLTALVSHMVGLGTASQNTATQTNKVSQSLDAINQQLGQQLPSTANVITQPLQAALTDLDRARASMGLWIAQWQDLARRANDAATAIDKLSPLMQQIAQQQAALAGEGGLLGISADDLTLLAEAGAELDALGRRAREQAEQGAGTLRRQLQDLANQPILEGRDAQIQRQANAELAYLDRVTAARQQLYEAQQAQQVLQLQSVELTSQEAQLRLSMLPVQEQFLETQRQLTQLQLQAQITNLPEQQALQSIQARIAIDQAIQRDITRPLGERARAQAEGLRLTVLDLPAAQSRALIGAEPGRQLAQVQAGVELQQQLVNNTQAMATQGLDYAKTQVDLLTEISSAVVAQRQQQVTLVVQGGLSLDVSGSGLAGLSADDEQAIVDAATGAWTTQLHAAVQAANGAANPALPGAARP